MRIAITISIALCTFVLGLLTCWLTQVMPRDERINAASDYTLRLQSEASVADQRGLVHDNNTLAHNMRVLREVLSGQRNPDGSARP